MVQGRRRKQARARQSLRWAVGLFFAVQLVGGLLLDYRWPEIRFPSVARTLKALSRTDVSPEIMCLGSSRFGAAFAQDRIADWIAEATGRRPVVFNASIEAGDLITADYLMARILERGIRPKVVVIEVSPETLARRNEWLGQHLIRQLTWADVPSYSVETILSGNLMRMLSSRLVPLYVHRRQIRRHAYDWFENAFKPRHQAKRSKKPRRRKPRKMNREETQGVPWEVFMSMNGPPAPPVRTQAGLHVIRRWLRHYEVGGSAAASLQSLVRRCRHADIDVVLVGVPVTKAHRNLYSPAIDHAFLAHVRSIARRYQCRFVDFRAAVPDSMFLDNHHVLPTGGIRFSRLLTTEVLLPMWTEAERHEHLAARRNIGTNQKPRGVP